MQKLLYAINHEKTETAITKKLNEQEYVIVGTVPHREALLKAIGNSGATVLLYRESLKGSADTFELMKMIRTDYPDLRIIFIANEQSAASLLLARLVFLGIYDIINTDKTSLTDIVDVILNPRNFGYAERFFRVDYLEEMLPALPERGVIAERKKPRLFEGLIPKGSVPVPVESKAEISTATDFELMRSAMLEEARRKAQAELPELVKMQVKDAHAELTKELANKERSISKLNQQIQELEKSEHSLKLQITRISQQKELLESQSSAYKEEAEKTISHYQEQLKSLQTTQSPQWYQDQLNEWQAERDGYLGKIEKLAMEISKLTELTEEHDDNGALSEALVRVAELENRIQQLDLTEQMTSNAEAENPALIAARAQILMLSNQLTSLRKNGNNVEEIETLQHQLSAAKAEANSTATMLNDANRKLAEMQQHIQELKSELDEANTQRSVPSQSIDLQELAEARAKIIQLNAALEVEREAVEELETKLSQIEPLYIATPHEPEAGQPLKFAQKSARYMVGSGEGRMIAFVGAKPGVGNTSVALNTAVCLAEQGHKTLLVEVDPEYPMIPSLFEFCNHESGLDTVLSSLATNNLSIAAQHIVKPHSIIPSSKELGKVYKALPQALHFLNYSAKHSAKDCHMTNESFKDLSYFLLTQEQYSFVIFDIQSNDFATMQAVLTGNGHVHQLLVTTTQDPHSVSSAKRIFNVMRSIYNPSLVANAHLVVNQFAPQNKMTVKKISEYLAIKEDLIHKITFDGPGYLNANFAALPYRLTKEKYGKEYDQLVR